MVLFEERKPVCKLMFTVPIANIPLCNFCLLPRKTMRFFFPFSFPFFPKLEIEDRLTDANSSSVYLCSNWYMIWAYDGVYFVGLWKIFFISCSVKVQTIMGFRSNLSSGTFRLCFMACYEWHCNCTLVLVMWHASFAGTVCLKNSWSRIIWKWGGGDWILYAVGLCMFKLWWSAVGFLLVMLASKTMLESWL